MVNSTRMRENQQGNFLGLINNILSKLYDISVSHIFLSADILYYKVWLLKPVKIGPLFNKLTSHWKHYNGWLQTLQKR